MQKIKSKSMVGGGGVHTSVCVECKFQFNVAFSQQ